MKVMIEPKKLGGELPAICSKSHIHRLLICAALGDRDLFLPCRTLSRDMLATARCLNALGAGIKILEDGFAVSPIARAGAETALLDCGESGSTYRFLVPVVCALGRAACFKLSGKLPDRPMDGLWSVLETHGARISGKGTASPMVSGPIRAGSYTVPGNVSSQFISGLLFALPLLPGESEIRLSSEAASRGYIDMTLDVLRKFSVSAPSAPNGFRISGPQTFVTPEEIVPEGDWSNSAFWLCAAAAVGSGITVTGLSAETSQGDRAVCGILRRFGASVTADNGSVTVRPGELQGIDIEAEDTPDLVPAIAVAAAAARGTTVIRNVSRLRLKESDRIFTVCEALNALGGSTEHDDNTIVIHGRGRLSGGTVYAHGDHRIAMLAASASVICEGPVTIEGAEAVGKSYPDFFADFAALGGHSREEGDIQ
jgi:3-phosphoshikimate 1-carboxyvinyltransferase